MEAPQISPPPEKISQNSGRASVSSQVDVNGNVGEDVEGEGRGDPHTLAKGPSVTGSRGHHWGCGIVLAGLEGKGDRVPVAWGGVWGQWEVVSSPQAAR